MQFIICMLLYFEIADEKIIYMTSEKACVS